MDSENRVKRFLEPDELRRLVKSYQRHGLWMYRMSEDEPRGEPGHVMYRLWKKYNWPNGGGINLTTGEIFE